MPGVGIFPFGSTKFRTKIHQDKRAGHPFQTQALFVHLNLGLQISRGQ